MNLLSRFPAPGWGVLLLVAFAGSTGAGEVIDVAPLRRWVQAQQSIQSISCSFTQERKIRTLRKPLVAEGRFWYCAPDHFRWQLGEPPRNIALHTGDQLTMVDVKKKRATVLNLTGGDARSRFGAYFDLGFPRTWESFSQTFDVISLRNDGDVLHAEVSPRNRQMANGVKSVRFVIDIRTHDLLQFTLDLRDGSAIATTFSDVKKNVAVASSTFTVSLEGFKVMENNE